LPLAGVVYEWRNSLELFRVYLTILNLVDIKEEEQGFIDGFCALKVGDKSFTTSSLF